MIHYLIYAICLLIGAGICYFLLQKKFNNWNIALSDFVKQLKVYAKNNDSKALDIDVPENLQVVTKEIAGILENQLGKKSDAPKKNTEAEHALVKTQLNNIHIINELGQKITSSLLLEETFDHLSTTLNSMMDAAVVELGVFDLEKENWSIYSNLQNENSSEYRNHFAEWVQSNNRLVFLEDAEKDFGRYVSTPLQLQNGSSPKSLMAFPIIFHEKVGGVITVISHRANAFDEYHQENIESLLGFLSVALENAFTHEQVNLLKIRAEESEKHEQQFLANMSHEIRTPMNAVLGMTNLLLDTSMDAKQLKYLNAINVSSKNLLVIINDILDLSKLEAGKMEIEKIPFRIKDVIDNVNDTSKFKAEEKGLKFIVNIDSDLPEVVKGDPTRLNQIITNLCSNAVKFTEKGHIIIDVKSTTESHFIEFKVTDTGIGIPEDKLHLLFSNFKQVDSSTFRKFGGTGLGLSISKTLIELQGGKVSVKSRIGQGSVFSVSIPYETGTAEDVAALEREVVIDYSGLEGVRVLVAEDNEYNQIVVNDTLESLIPNVFVDIAENGVIAVEMVQANAYDLVLMDAQMPEMDGLEATRVIRKLSDNVKNKIPILALTASVHKADIDRCLDSGMDDFVPKPFATDELLGSMAKFYNKPKSNTAQTVEKSPIVDREEEKSEEKVVEPIIQDATLVTDMVFLKKFTKDDPARMKKYIGLYLKLLPDNLSKIEAAIEAKDHDTLLKVSHAMRPHLNYMGMQKAAELAAELEQNVIEKKHLENVVGMAQTVLDYCVQSKKELEVEIEKYQA